MAKRKAAASTTAPAGGTVQVEALEEHTLHGKAYSEGQTYAAPADLVDSLEAQGKAFRTDSAAITPGSTAARKRSHATAMEPMTIDTTAAVAGKRGRGKVAVTAPTPARAVVGAKKGAYKRKDLRAKR